MARAKRTDRAEARRRYRAAADIDESARRGDARAPLVAADTTSAGAGRGQTPARMGFAAAFRAAIQPAQRPRPTWPPCPGSRSTPRRSGCRC